MLLLMLMMLLLASFVLRLSMARHLSAWQAVMVRLVGLVLCWLHPYGPCGSGSRRRS